VNVQQYRKRQLKSLTNEIGVYALCDLDNIPLYVGQSFDGIRNRVQRHLTSARSDVIANREIDIWEVAFVWAWPMPGETKSSITEVETFLIHEFHTIKPLMNGDLPPPSHISVFIPSKQEVQVLSSEEIEKRKDPLLRLPRQIRHFNDLFSHILEVKNEPETRRALRAHFDRLSEYYETFIRRYND
jgi:Uri superfamily endonuclease